ncbi:MAG: phytoene/squalene synthase family protein [marine benthic group bacterium]|nr:phytoene/squalene synthase family protein [Gemmatimonadota bacterium]MCL7961832.1 phytoene/squalene synthase family protein [Candidatus Carthagonibacter metallireducens]MCL7978181.1 phytoene/squalene synthase family protein [Gemmatimonadota bacterium]MCL7978877.1 phytoene/squalene synthase family protein [Gemmatimonadota bacterium]MCL7984465.1 phytoene/squalene synthase family protein [Gemmatimonadota bacterium]
MTSADRRACREILRHGSKSFHAASLLLPAEVRDAAAALYAFCRVADNAVDEREDSAAAAGEDVLVGLDRRLDAVYSDAPLSGPVERAFRSVVREYAIPREVPAALLEGLRWDEEGRGYEELSDLYDYAVRVGSTVGVMMTLVMGRRDAETLADAAELGMAMQLTNICRDVGEDARRGRLYLPARPLRESGMHIDDWLASPAMRPEIANSISLLLDDADRLYARSWKGIARLPSQSRPAIRAASLLYAEIGNEIRSAGFDSVSRRAWTSRGTKLAILARAALFARAPRSAFPAAAGSVGGATGQPDLARQAAAGLVRAASNFRPGAG